jgi:hypothetical protein
MRAATLLLVLVAVSCAACGGGGSKTAQIGWKTHHVADGGFSIEVPAAWRTLEKFDQRNLDEFVADNPQFAAIKQAIKGGLIKFVAADPDVVRGFATNVNVTVHSLERPITLSAYEQAMVESEKQALGVAIQSEKVRLPAGRCLRLTYGFQANLGDALRSLSGLQYACLRNQTEYVVTFTTLEGQRARYRTTFERSARSFRFD